MKTLIKNLLKTTPKFYGFAASANKRIVCEIKILKQFGLGSAYRKLRGRKPQWQKILPIQKPRRVEIASGEVGPECDLLTFLKLHKVDFEEGGHTFYLPPESLQKSPFKDVIQIYPANVGLKISKNQGGVEESRYVTGSQHSAIQKMFLYSHRHLMLVAAFLRLQRLGPRLYDLIEIQSGTVVWTGYIVSHCAGRAPTLAECKTGINHLKNLVEDKQLEVVAPGGFENMDFQCPKCNNNCIMDSSSGNFQYIDFQNFILPSYGKYLEGLALKAASDTHFGEKSILRGGKYLYQSVPAVDLPAKRCIESRIPVMKDLLKQANLLIDGKVVLDFGCNIGMMIAQYLKMGALWCHGWDLDRVTAHTETLLLALGCTRFSLTSGAISNDQPVESDLSLGVRKQLDNCVISYLAIRGHIQWIAALGRLPWEFMIYEGHEEETISDLERNLKELNGLTPVALVTAATYKDGDSDPRTIAIIRRGKAS